MKIPCWMCAGSGVSMFKQKSKLTEKVEIAYAICVVCDGTGIKEAGDGARAYRESQVKQK